MVVETIGGVEAAYEYTRRALAAGKHVVTANKQLVAEKGCELLSLAKKKGVNYLFEASVGGGIPILHPLTQCMAANRVDEVYGILNGTTNYILTRMVRAGASFANALREAQEKGYAEADPTADIEGIDAGRKICILADLAFGHQVDPALLPHRGDQQAVLAGCEAGRAGGLPRQAAGPGSPPSRRRQDCLRSAPPGFGEQSALRRRGRIQRRGGSGQCHRRGHVLWKGCREMPTASACVADVMEAIQQSPRREEIGWSPDSAGFEDPLALPSQYYFRVEGSLADAAAAFGRVEVLSENGETAFLTDRITGQDAMQRARSLKVLACMRVLG